MRKSLKWMKQARCHDNQTQTQNPINPNNYPPHWNQTLTHHFSTKMTPKPHLKNHQNRGRNIEHQNKIITSNIYEHVSPETPILPFFMDNKSDCNLSLPTGYSHIDLHPEWAAPWALPAARQELADSSWGMACRDGFLYTQAHWAESHKSSVIMLNDAYWYLNMKLETHSSPFLEHKACGRAFIPLI